jgi:hypothetical protein
VAIVHGFAVPFFDFSIRKMCVIKNAVVYPLKYKLFLTALSRIVTIKMYIKTILTKKTIWKPFEDF